jgi:hypothetical protein
MVRLMSFIPPTARRLGDPPDERRATGTQAISTSLLPGDIGYWAIAILYGANTIGSLLISSGLVSWLGPKWSIFIGSITYVMCRHPLSPPNCVRAISCLKAGPDVRGWVRAVT